MISIEDYLTFVDDALDGLITTVTELGDEHANHSPGFPGTNSPYAILTHCLGVMEWWGGYMLSGRVVDRDRAAEFHATGTVADLARRAEQARVQLRADARDAEPSTPPRGTPDEPDVDLPLARTQGGVLMHIYEELAQHRGHAEITRDVLLAR